MIEVTQEFIKHELGLDDIDPTQLKWLSYIFTELAIRNLVPPQAVVTGARYDVIKEVLTIQFHTDPT